MRFLANENIPVATIRHLRAASHDVASIIEDSPERLVGLLKLASIQFRGQFTVVGRGWVRQRPLLSKS